MVCRMIDISSTDYVACICEGSSEMNILSLLLEADALIFSQPQLINDEILPPKYRVAKKFCDEYLTMDYGTSKIAVFVIQDRKNVSYKISSPYSNKITGPHIVVTAPEIEMLMIHSLNLYNEYKKSKGNPKPSIFLAQHLREKTAKIKSTSYIRDFYKEHDLIEAIHIHKTKSAKLTRRNVFLADILNSMSDKIYFPFLAHLDINIYDGGFFFAVAPPAGGRVDEPLYQRDRQEYDPGWMGIVQDERHVQEPRDTCQRIEAFQKRSHPL